MSGTQLTPNLQASAVGPGLMCSDLCGGGAVTAENSLFAPTDRRIDDAVTLALPLPHMDPASYAGMYVALALRQNSAATNRETVNTIDGTAMRGLMLIAAQVTPAPNTRPRPLLNQGETL